MKYQAIRTKPVATFFYKGTHSHPIQRVVLITETNGDMIKGYELQEGKNVRDVESAPIKTFLKEKVASYNQLRKSSANWKDTDETTLQRMSLTAFNKVAA